VTRGVASAAIATVTGNQVFGDAYLVQDGVRTYSVLDVYARSDSALDTFSSVYGVASFKASWIQDQTVDFVHAGNSSWNPNYTDAPGATWDSFVTCGMRVQESDEYGSTPILLTADPGFSNFNTANAKRVVGPVAGNGPGWFPAAGANPEANPFCRFSHYNGIATSVNRAKAAYDVAGNGIAPNQSLDNHLMIGRFAIDVTGLAAGTTRTMTLKFAMTAVSDGVIRSGSVDTAFRVNQTLRFAVPAAPAPTGVSAADGGSTSGVTVSWTASAGATAYRILRGVGSATTLIGTSAGTSFTDTTAVPGTVYTYAVRAVSGTDESPSSAVDTGYRRVSAPTAVAASDGTVATGVTVTWTAATGVSRYKVLRSEGDAPAEIATAAGTSYTDTSALPCVSYTYTVVSEGPGGTLDSGASAGDTGDRPITAPSGLAASDGGPASVGLTWNAVPGATVYRIRRGIGSASAEIGTTDTNAFTDASAVPGRLYTYAVLAEAGCSSLPSTSNTGWRSLSAPTSLSAADGASTTGVTLSWTASTGATGYRVFRGIGSASTQIAAVTGTSYVDTSAVPGTIYTYAVRASGDVGTDPSAASATNSGWRGLAAPATMTASGGTSTSRVDLSWSAITGAARYEIHRGTGSTLTLLASTTATSYADGSASVGTVYTYAIRAVGPTGTGPGVFSTRVTGFRASGSAPTGVVAADGASTAGVKVDWAYGSGATGFRILRSVGNGAPTVVGSASRTARTFFDTTATPGTIYNYQVRAVLGASGDGLPSTANAGYRALSAPGGVRASDETSADHVEVTWNAVAGARGYRIYRAQGSGTPTKIGTATSSERVFRDTSAVVRAQYSYSVRAAGQSGTAVGASSAADRGMRALGVPTDVRASDGTSSARIVVTWTAPLGASRYGVFRSIGSGAATQVATVTTTRFVDTGVTPGVVHRYQVRAMEATGTFRTAASTADSGWRALPAPTGVAASDGTSPSRVTVTWNAVPGARGYRVFRATGSATPTQVGLTSASSLSFNDTSAAAGTNYSYTVKATGPSGIADSAASAANAGWRALPAPTGVTASDGTSSEHVRVTWRAQAGATVVNIYRAEGSATPGLAGIAMATAGFFDDVNAIPGRVYRYSARFFGESGTGNGASSASDTGYRALAAPTGLASTSEESRIRLSWTMLRGATSYRIYRGTSPASLTLLATTSARTYDDVSAQRGVTYTYRISALFPQGEGPRSDSVTGQRTSTRSGMAPPPDDESDKGSDQTLMESLAAAEDAPSVDPESLPMGLERYLALVSVEPDASGIECDMFTDAEDDAADDLEGATTTTPPEDESRDVGPSLPWIDMDDNGVPDLCQLRRGDLDLNGQVDSADMAALLLLVGTQSEFGIGDLIPDGVIDALDVSELARRLEGASEPGDAEE
jgi:fibronectin type 3 domain-containing protein